MTANSDIFTTIVDSSFYVDLVRDGKTLKLKCRELPFMTLLKILTNVVSAGQQEILAARRQLFEDIVQAGVTGVSPEQVRELATPLVMAVVHQMPSLVEDTLLDIVLDSSPENLKYLTLEDMAAIFNAVCYRIDYQLLADKIRPVFSHAAKTMQKVFEDQAENMKKADDAKKKVKSGPRKSSPQKPSQE